jgi:hypothetical protein
VQVLWRQSNLDWEVVMRFGLLRFGIAAVVALALAAFGEDVERGGRPVSYEGQVTGPDGKSVPGAQIAVVAVSSSSENKVIRRIKCGEDGKFAIDDVTVSPQWPSHRLFVRADGLAMGQAGATWQEENNIQLGEATRVRVVFLGPDEKPVSGLGVKPVLIMMRGPGLSGGFLPEELVKEMEQRTDENGACTFSNLPRQAMLRLRVDDERFAKLQYRQQVSLGDAAQSPPATLHLKRAASISGRIVYSTLGKPAAGVHVMARSVSAAKMDYGKGVSDEKGEYRIPQMQAGEYNIVLNEHGDLGKEWTAAVLAKVRVGEGEDLAGRDINLIRGCVIEGKVTRGDTVETIGGMTVGAGESRAGGHGIQCWEKTAADGSFSIRVPPGTFRVYLSSPPPDGYQGTPQREVTVADGQTVSADLKLRRKPGQPVVGRVVGPDDKPLGGAYVMAEGKDDQIAGAWQESDETGMFHFEAITRGTLLRAARGALESAEAVEVDGGEQDIVLRLSKRIRVTLSGVVIDADGKPIKGARVTLMEFTGQSARGMGNPELTDGQGRYSVQGLRVGLKYGLSVEADGYGPGSGPVVLAPGKATAEAQPVKLAVATMRIAGRVVDRHGKGVAGVEVTLNGGGAGFQTLTSDAEGKFSFKVVEEAKPLIFIRGEDGQPMGSRGVQAGDTALELVDLDEKPR